MKKLVEILDGAQTNNEISSEDSLYAIVALSSLLAFTQQNMRRLNMELGTATRNQIMSESEEQLKAALNQPPKVWLGWGNDPRNPDFRRRLAEQKRIYGLPKN